MLARSDGRVDGGPPAPAASYIRGAAVPAIDARRVVRTVVTIVAVLIGLLAAVTAVQVHQAEVRRHALADHGVPADLVVTGCTGLASGTGITASSYTCRGTVALRGRVYDDVLTGIAQPLAPGARVAVLVDPSAPTRVSTPQVARVRSGAGRLWLGLAALALVLVLVVVLVLVLVRAPGAARLRSAHAWDRR
jgi:hypothetical protein